MSIPVKLLMTWDIATGHEEDCLAFVAQDLPIAMKQAGFELTDRWFTSYGGWPQIRVGFVSPDLEQLERFLVSGPWRQLKTKLLPFTQDYHEKAILARGGFQF